MSRTQAGLPDFSLLAHCVVQELGATSEGPARRVLEEAAKIDRIAGVIDAISYDRIFGFLENLFRPRYRKRRFYPVRRGFPSRLSCRRMDSLFYQIALG